MTLAPAYRRLATPSQEYLQEILEYSVITGLLYWKVSRRSHARKGAVAGGVGTHGYPAIRIDGTRYQCHNIIWKLVTGEDPPDHLLVDHIDQVRTNNAWHNLRLLTHGQQQLNMHRPVGVSGEPNIYKRDKPKPYQVKIKREGRMHTRSFLTMAEAIAWRDEIRSQFTLSE